eukprot:g626.t1
MTLYRITALLLGCFAARGDIVGVDLGTEFMKLALIKPGKGMEIVTNVETKRKTPTRVAVSGDELIFGSNAVALEGRHPENTFPQLSAMLGRSAEDTRVRQLSKQLHYPLPIEQHADSGAARVKHGGRLVPPEELMASVLKHAASMAEAFGAAPGGGTRYVLTTPSAFGQPERRALTDAAKLAKIDLLALIDETSAAALQYASVKKFEKRTNILYFDFGAQQLQVTVASHASHESGRAFQIKSKVWEDGIGGNFFDAHVLNTIAKDVTEKRGEGNVLEEKRPIGQLRKISMKTKMVLSANTEAKWFVDGIGSNTELVASGLIAREDFEAGVKSQLDKVVPTVERAISEAGFQKSDIDAVELLGGATRMPRVQQLLAEYFGSDIELGVHLNGDEAMALGAAFHGARLSPTMRVRKVKMIDTTPHGIDVKFSCESGSWTKDASIFKVNSELNVKRSLIVAPKCTDDDGTITATLYAGKASIAEYHIKGLSAYRNKQSLPDGGKYRVSFTFLLDRGGVASLADVQAFVKKGKKGKPQYAEALQVESSNDSLAIKPLSDEEHASISDRLDAIEKAGKAKQLLDDTINELEALGAKVRNAFAGSDDAGDEDEDEEDEDEDALLRRLSSADERQQAQSIAASTSEWLDGADPASTSIDAYAAKLKALKDVVEPLFERAAKEVLSQAAAAKARSLFKSVKSRIKKFTPAERKQAQKALDDAQSWLKSTKSPAPEEVDGKLAAFGKEIDDLEAKSNEDSEEL